MLNVAQLPVSFNIYNTSVDSAVTEVSVSFIVPAVRKAVAENDEEDPSHTTVCFDSSWQNVRCNFLNDIISVTSLGSGEVLHVEIMSKLCFVFHANLTSKHKYCCSTVHFCRIASIYQPTNAHIISHKTPLKHSDMFRSCQIIIRELSSLLKLYCNIHNSIGICKRDVVAAYHIA